MPEHQLVLGSHAARRAPDEDTSSSRDLARAVVHYLQLRPRQLPSRFLYDALGSALFDAICLLPWYRVTRAELGLLRRHARAVGDLLRRGGRVVELGSGNGEKLAALLRHAGLTSAHAHLIDLSRAALERAVQALRTSSGITKVRVTTEHATYEDGLLRLPASNRPTLVAFLGSNIGNFDPPGASAFLQLIRAALRPGDHLLLGADLVKPESELLLAYDDPIGLTAAFDKNLLVRLNTELGANFPVTRFAHRAVWNRDASRVEMHLVSLDTCEVTIPDPGFTVRFAEGETIWTESSYKYERDGIRALVDPAGFAERQQWIDDDAAFSLALFEAV